MEQNKIEIVFNKYRDHVKGLLLRPKRGAISFKEDRLPSKRIIAGKDVIKSPDQLVNYYNHF